MNYDNICPICFNEFDKDICGNIINLAITNCNHKFCLQCIIIHGKRKYNCPLCRGEFINPSCISPRNNLSEELQREQEMIFNVAGEDEVDTWYGINNTNQNLYVPRIDIVYDASNVTFSLTDENIANLRNIEVNNRYNEVNTLETEYHIYRLQNSIYDLAMSMDSTTSEEDNNEEDNNNIG